MRTGCSDGVISILPPADRHIPELGFSDVPFYYVPNGVVSDAPAEDAPENVLHAVQEARAKGKCILMYLGGFSKANALDDLLSAAPLLPVWRTAFSDRRRSLKEGDRGSHTEKRPFKRYDSAGGAKMAGTKCASPCRRFVYWCKTDAALPVWRGHE